jgi:hypothetical protein
MTKDEARKIAAGIAKLPELLEAARLRALIAERESPGTSCCLRRLPQRRAGTPSTDGRMSKTGCPGELDEA